MPQRWRAGGLRLAGVALILFGELTIQRGGWALASEDAPACHEPAQEPRIVTPGLR